MYNSVLSPESVLDYIKDYNQDDDVQDDEEEKLIYGIVLTIQNMRILYLNVHVKFLMIIIYQS